MLELKRWNKDGSPAPLPEDFQEMIANVQNPSEQRKQEESAAAAAAMWSGARLAENSGIDRAQFRRLLKSGNIYDQVKGFLIPELVIPIPGHW